MVDQHGGPGQNPETLQRKKTLVVCNIPQNSNTFDMARSILSYHNFNPKDIVKAQRGRNRHSPLMIELTSIATKWMLLNEINKHKVRGAFARPYMTRDELVKDRKLRRELQSTRKSNPEKGFKIVKNEIHEITSSGSISIPSKSETVHSSTKRKGDCGTG